MEFKSRRKLALQLSCKAAVNTHLLG
eukprot:COSAG06_NODE_62057_length_266_cov_0.610778_1_plen_25_part_10